jgi:hypothetical protein
MQIQMILGFGLGILIIAGVLIWHFILNKSGTKTNVTVKQHQKTRETGLRSLSTREIINVSSRDIPVNTQQAPEDIVIKLPKYNAMVFHWQDGIIFKKIPDKLGEIVTLDQSMPVHGSFLLAVEKEDDKINSYDPRNESIVAAESPQKAYRAIKWDVVNRLFAYDFGMWDKINNVLIWVSVAGCFLIAIMAIGG